MIFLITGAGFSNTGALAMMDTVVSELRHRFPLCDIYIANSAKFPKKLKNKVDYTYFETGVSEFYAIATFTEKLKFVTRNIVKKLLGRQTETLHLFEEVVKSCDVVLDISGYALSNKWSYFNNMKFLSRIELAKKYQKPIFLLPQSFGPFDYKDKQTSLIERIKKDLNYPIFIYAREKQGYDLLTKEYGLLNVKRSSDIVLQSTKINKDNDDIVAHIANNISPESVAIVPNIHCYSYNPKELINCYKMIITSLLKDGKTIFIVRHSDADLPVCEKIKEYFKNEEKVVLCKELLNNKEFSLFIKKFKFLIASRYHSIVHAYKMCIPCLVIGWADKYVELLDSFDQLDYFTHIDNINESNIVIDKLKNLDNRIYKSKSLIKEHLHEISKESVFDDIEQYVKMNLNNV